MRPWALLPLRFLRRRRPRTEESPALGGEPPPRRPGPEPRRSRRWRALGCSVTGTYHLDAGQPCEDVSAVVECDAEVILAVADGAGSASRAFQGANLVVGAACDAVVRRLAGEGAPGDPAAWEEVVTDAVRSARRALEEYGRPLAELASTLLLAVLCEDTLAVAQVGDGWVVAEDRNGSFRAVTLPGKGEYFNETTFVTSDSYLEDCSRRVEAASGIAGLAVLSDGLETVACDLRAGCPSPGFFGPLFAFARAPDLTPEAKRQELARFLGSRRVNRRTHDDKTLLLAVRSGSKVKPPPSDAASGAAG